MGKKNYRDMSQAELEEWRREKLEAMIEKNPGEAHRRALRTMQNPTRREILILLKDTAQSIEKLCQALQLDETTLQYHLQFLKDVFFITVEKELVDLTPPGIAYLRNALG